MLLRRCQVSLHDTLHPPEVRLAAAELYPQARLGCPVHRLIVADCSSAHCLRQLLQVTAAGRRSKCCGCSVCMQEWRQPLSLGAEREPFNGAERETRCVWVLERGVLGNRAVRALKNNNIISDYFGSKTETEQIWIMQKYKQSLGEDLPGWATKQRNPV